MIKLVVETRAALQPFNEKSGANARVLQRTTLILLCVRLEVISKV
jgi:hypothetical protein